LDVVKLYLFKSFFHTGEEPIPFIKLVDCESKEIEELYYKMYSEYEGAKRGYTAILRAHVIELLVKLLRIIYNENEEEKLLNNSNNQIIDKVLDFISINYAKNIRLEELSMMAFLSPSHFCRKFKEYTGVTISEYTQKVRIDEACRLLRKTDNKVVDIALQVGYNDIKYFNEVFKRYIGFTPGQYRKEK
jgi:AraC-like DNA-binding protein